VVVLASPGMLVYFTRFSSPKTTIFSPSPQTCVRVSTRWAPPAFPLSIFWPSTTAGVRRYSRLSPRLAQKKNRKKTDFRPTKPAPPGARGTFVFRPSNAVPVNFFLPTAPVHRRNESGRQRNPSPRPWETNGPTGLLHQPSGKFQGGEEHCERNNSPAAEPVFRPDARDRMNALQFSRKRRVRWQLASANGPARK